MERSCRICMGNEADIIFKGFFDKSHKFAENLFYVSEIVVFETSNNLPALICHQCEDDLETAARIKKISIETDNFLKTVSSTADIQLLSTIINSQNFSLNTVLKHESNEIKNELNGLQFDSSMIKVEVLDEFLVESFDEPMPKFESDVEWSLNDTKSPPKPKNSLKSTRKPRTKTPKEKKENSASKYSEKARAQRREYQRNLPMLPCPFEGCTRFIKGSVRLKDHLTSHSDARNFSCEHCGKGFKTSKNLRVHRKLLHTNMAAKLRWICDICGKDFQGKPHLRQHVENMHLDKNKEICDLCGKVLSSRGTLKTHMLYTHNTEGKNFECPTCNKKYFTKERLKQHILTHGERSWICELCNKGFTRRYKLGEHYKQVHHKKLEDVHRHVCSLCLKGFDRHSNLQEHMRVTHEVVFEGDA